MKEILNLYKEIGETPLERLNKLRKKNPKYLSEKMSYVGRLDPMAEGVLLVVVGDENKKREKYLNLDKEYEFEALLGLKSDSHDILGLAEFVDDRELDKKKIKTEFQSFVKKSKQKYPAFSSKTINGKPLFEITKSSYNQLGASGAKLGFRPEREIEIYKAEILGFKEIKLGSLKKGILNKINLVKGDFRQKETIKKWNKIFDLYKEKKFLTFKAKIKCSSGTYVRSIVDEIGKNLGCGAITLNIKRTKVGKYNIKNSTK